MRTFVLAFLALSPLYYVSAADDQPLAAKARQVLRRHCVECHSGQDDDDGFNVLNAAAMRSSDEGYVIAQDPEESLVYLRIIDEDMPPAANRELQPVTEEEREILRQWIAGGATDFPQADRSDFVSIESIYSAALGYLRNAAREDRPQLRFFTLHNVYNRRSTDPSDLRFYRAGLSKVLNSLTWERRITLPDAVEVDGVNDDILYVIDLKEFGWDRQRNANWNELQKAYPYGLSFEFSQHHGEAHENDLAVQGLTQTQIPVLRADWFVATATRPPLYHKLLQIPTDARSLEARLEVSIASDFLNPKPRRIARAGFARSGISGQNRLVQRSDALHGFYWKSYDFKPDTGRAKLTRFPLGPANLFEDRRHPFERFAFEHDGGEVIFSLPNGMQAYMLVDGEDQRIDVGPITVVSDARRTSGTPEIVNGLSCIACHRHGMIKFKDSIRLGNATFGEVEQHVERLYPEREAMDELLQEDQQRFMQALRRCISTYFNDEDDLQSFDEPVRKVAVWHRSVYLDLNTVLTELDLKEETQLLRVGDNTLKRLGLESLMKGGVISRPEWEALDSKFGPSLMQQIATELGATPVLPL
ncbi:c-type cytochrome domain-containing protein [Stieleria neptunia]|nr:c-type cytochrome domain-containing protein [Stieleria neptunia]